MYDNIEQELIMNYLEGEYNLLNILIVIDFIVIIISYIFFKSSNNNIKQLKRKFYCFFIIDFFIYLIKKYSLNRTDIHNELLISLLYSIQILLIISYLEQMCKDFSPIYNGQIIDPYKESIIFLFINISYDKMLSSPPFVLYLTEFLLVFILTFKYKNYINNKFNEIDIIIEKENNTKEFLLEYIKDISNVFTFLIFLYYCVKSLITFIYYYDIFIFVKIILLIVKTASRIMINIMIILIHYIFEKYYK